MNFPEIGHVGYMVESVDASVKKLGEAWGIQDFVAYDFVPQRAWSYGEEIFDCKLRIALGTPAAGAKVELVEYVGGTNTPHERFMREKGENIHHIAYYVDDYEAARAYVLSQPGGAIIFEAEIEDETLGKRRSFYCTYDGAPGVYEFSKKPTKLK